MKDNVDKGSNGICIYSSTVLKYSFEVFVLEYFLFLLLINFSLYILEGDIAVLLHHTY